MAKADTAPPADDQSVDQPTEDVEEEVQEEEQSLGDLQPNSPPEEAADTSAEAETEVEEEAAEGEAPPEAEAGPREPVAPPPPEPDEAGVYAPPTTADPGEFQPGDYSFTVQTTDGRTHRISSPEDADGLARELDNNPDLISASQFMQLSRKTALMEQGIANDQRAYEQAREEWETQANQQQVREQTLQNIYSGLSYLEGRGLIDKVPPELDRADVKWEDHTDNPAIKQRLDILKYMEDENNARMSAGLLPNFDPIAAQTAMELETIRNRDKETSSREKTINRSRGALVGKKAPYQPSNPQPGTITGEARGLQDLQSELYYASQE